MRELILPDYEILSELGHGAMGIVYKAQQYSLDRFVALKVLAPELARDPTYIERFKREAIIAATVVHPNIVTVYEAGAHLNLDTGERVHYFVMEYVEGETMQQRLARQNRIPADEVAAIGVRIAEGLESAWKKARVIHRDIKPSNIFLSNDGDVKIGDLGLARVAGDAQSSLTATGAIIGTAYYMSPEQARGKDDVDFRSDIYSLGCALYRMLCGKHPFEGSFANVIVQHLTEPPPGIRTIVPDCPMSIVRVIEKMLAKDPSGRQQTYAELIEELRQAHERILFREPPQADEAEAAAPVSRKQMTLALGVIAAAVAVVGVLW
ncbi:MAG: serine/threonine-protein kinase [Verrucomicrobia bacterium]|nr:serine/threonine-protein kinase [Verrucomicrobiota bacterium]